MGAALAMQRTPALTYTPPPTCQVRELEFQTREWNKGVYWRAELQALPADEAMLAAKGVRRSKDKVRTAVGGCSCKQPCDLDSGPVAASGTNVHAE